MLRKLRNVFLAGTVILGFGSDSSALAGSADSGAELRDRARFTDDKGHFRPDWRVGINRPAHVGDQAIARTHETVGEWLARASASGEKAPYALTGKGADDQGKRKQERFTDPKGRFRPDWRSGINTPRPE